jgi:hypothetical protein
VATRPFSLGRRIRAQRRRRSQLLTLLLPALVAAAAAPAAEASLPGFVNSLGTAVCWSTGDYRYAKELTRAAGLWNEVAGAPRILHESQGCIPNFRVKVDVLRRKTDIQGITWDGDVGYRGEIVLYKAALDRFRRCRKWIALHELGHALGLEHVDKRRTVMYGTCGGGYRSKPVNRPTARDAAQYWQIWGRGPRGIESDEDLLDAVDG